MDEWTIVYTTQARKDAKKLAASELESQARELLLLLRRNPFQTPPPIEKLRGDLSGACSRRINLPRRLVYQVFEDRKTIKIVRKWTHYE